MIARYQEEQTVVAVKKFYSEISQAYNAAIAKNGPPDTWSWVMSNSGVEHIMDILAPHLRIMNRCGAGGSQDKCFGNVIYKTLNLSVDWLNPSTTNEYSAARLDNGSIFFVYAFSGTCNYSVGTTKQLNSYCGIIGVDINGYKKPNALGRDTFLFEMTKYGIVPIGTRYETYWPLNTRCNLSNTSTSNGYGCTAWIIERGNMDYLHHTVSWEE